VKTSLFDYKLPRAQIAEHPTSVRRKCRLLRLDRTTGAISHHSFEELPQLLAPRDLLVVNDTSVIPARLLGHKEGTGGRAEILLLEQIGRRRWRAMVKPGARLRPGARVVFETPTARVRGFTAVIEDTAPDGLRIVVFEGHGRFDDWLQQVGRMPLPPYIARASEPRDQKDYQTVYARHPGAVAAPTAGLHFDQVLLARIRKRRIGVAPLTLHVGAGTFRPITVDRIEDHELHSERYRISGQTQRRLHALRVRGEGRVVAVGTTAMRTLEAIASAGWGKQREAETDAQPAATRFTTITGETNLYIRPGHRFGLVDGLVTNFHLPQSSLLVLVSAFAGHEHVMRAYHEAVRERYRFYSYGDAMLII
jgi:S-adenosylmethionine:tRNA ribosyltransferase-isomerase